MNAVEMAAIHHAAFVHDRGWSAEEFTALLAQPYIAAFTAQGGFALTRTLAGETELLTLAVSPAHQRRGIASTLIRQWITSVQPTTQTAFLEVAADNYAALALYGDQGFIQSGLRKAYYKRSTSAAVDAALMTRALTQG